VMILQNKSDQIERAVLALVFQASDENMLWSLEDADFANPSHKFLFSELNGMVASGAPLGDPVACANWFCSEGAKKRATGIKEGNLPELSYEIFKTEVIKANQDYYMKLLRRNRLSRALKMLARMLNHKLTKAVEEPNDILSWLSGQVETINEKASEVLA